MGENRHVKVVSDHCPAGSADRTRSNARICAETIVCKHLRQTLRDRDLEELVPVEMHRELQHEELKMSGCVGGNTLGHKRTFAS
jgi:hypothetical protein